jgi:uncharacterized protein (TIGR00255 family)
MAQPAGAHHPGSLRSMTGFGAASLREETFEIGVELRSVNHRHLQVKTRLPAELSALEAELENRVRARVERGALSVSVRLVETGARPVVIDRALAARYKSEIEALAAELRLPEAVTMDTLLGLPGVVGTADDTSVRERETALLWKVLSAALDALIAMRETEARALVADLERNARAIGELSTQVAARMPEVVREHHRKLCERANELLAPAARIQPADLPRELALLAERMDVGEELSRLASHLSQWDKLLRQGGAVGRQLDFLVQELLREANTIGSKCNDATVAHAVVAIKTHIERLREQVQNLE